MLMVKCSWAFDKPANWESMSEEEQREGAKALLLQGLMEATNIEDVESFIDAGFDAASVKL